tara:strand:+ start:991 stop:1263 length:273 start_codon:yes stop_codon:yes gene_type:complete
MDIEKELKKLLISKDMTKIDNDDLDEDVFRLYHSIGNELHDLLLDAIVTVFNNYHEVLASENTPHYDVNAFYGNHIETDEMIEILIDYWK